MPKSDFNVRTCPKCGGKTGVLDSRHHGVLGFTTLIRRRECGDCGHRLSTLEISTELADIADLADLLSSMGYGD